MVIRKGTKVRWRWGNSVGKGRVEETYNRKTTKNIKGAEITRFGRKDNKVLYIKNDLGEEFLKLENEVERDSEENLESED